MYHIAESMVRWLAPILSFTAEEVWRHLPGGRPESVFHATWHELPAVAADRIDWAALMELRADVTRELEKLRDTGAIGAPLDARVDVYCPPAEYARFAALGSELRFLLITSHATVHESAAAPPEARAGAEHRRRGRVPRGAPEPGSEVRALLAPPCGCRREPRHPELCRRCVSNIEGPGEERASHERASARSSQNRRRRLTAAIGASGWRWLPLTVAWSWQIRWSSPGSCSISRCSSACMC